MKSALISVIGVLVGFTCAYFGDVRFGKGPVQQESNEGQKTYSEPFDDSIQIDSVRAISREEAYLMFYAYHQSTNPIESKGLLKSTTIQNEISVDSPISYFFLDLETAIAGITSKVAQEGKNLVGFAAIPVYDQASASHTLIWLGVVEELRDDSIPERKLFFPQNPNTVDYIFNHGETCPHTCATNNDRLWEVNWFY